MHAADNVNVTTKLYHDKMFKNSFVEHKMRIL